jgi:uncharacterized RDD family membrane protein YckC
MKRYIVFAAFALVVVLIFAAIVPLWVMTAGVSLPSTALRFIALMIIGCFGVGGGLMFLVFYSARKGYDDRVNNGPGWRNPDEG